MNQGNQPTQPALFKPRRVAVKIHYSAMSQFCYLWTVYDRPHATSRCSVASRTRNIWVSALT